MNRQLSPTPAGGYDYEPGYNRVRAEHQQDFTSYSQEYPRGAMSNYQVRFRFDEKTLDLDLVELSDTIIVEFCFIKSFILIF